MNDTPQMKVVPGSGGLHATGLGKRYKKRPVVRNVSLSLQRGEAVGLLGPNGAGKTTTFYMITGLVQPDEGRVIARRAQAGRIASLRAPPSSATPPAACWPRATA